MGHIRLALDTLLRGYAHSTQGPLSLDDLAQQTGIAPDMLVKLRDNQADQVALSDLARLCDALHCTPHDLLEYTPDSGDDDVEPAVESRKIVEQWERQYGDDEHHPDKQG